MYRFFADAENIGENEIAVTGEEKRHMADVLRLRPGEELRVCTRDLSDRRDFLCRVDRIEPEEVICRIIQKEDCRTELPVRITLYQALPKGDRMETVVQKSVELGVHAIVPVATKRTIVKLDPKKEKQRLARWNAISLSAAKQCYRGGVPEVEAVISYDEAIKRAQADKHLLFPYENAGGMPHTREVLRSINSGESISIFIGPEGGFEESEVDEAVKAGGEVISLGHRILRTDTAGPALIAAIMMQVEET